MDVQEKKGVGLNLASQIQYTDHLAVVSVLMNIPLLFVEEQDREIGKKYYPELQTEFQEYQDFNPEYLIANYDVLFMSDLWNRKSFHQKYNTLEQQYKKELRVVHCPHGFSDKGFYLQRCADEDITLIYGQNMIDLLKHHGVYDRLHQHVITGNYRYTYFKKHRDFYETLMQKEVLPLFAKRQPIILYAPTWLDMEESTTFFDAYSYLLDNLPSEYNLIVKLHPRLELDDAGKFYHIIGKYQNRPNVVFLKDFPLVYPLLSHTDIYLGDTSSIGYDFLAFNKPMFFLNKQRGDPANDRRVYLFRCGVSIQPEEYATVYQIIEKNLANDAERFAQIRKDVYFYTFGEERPFAKIKEDIIQAYNSKRLT